MLAVAEVTELLSELNVSAPILREISSDKDHEQALSLIKELIRGLQHQLGRY